MLIGNAMLGLPAHISSIMNIVISCFRRPFSIRIERSTTWVSYSHFRFVLIVKSPERVAIVVFVEMEFLQKTDECVLMGYW